MTARALVAGGLWMSLIGIVMLGLLRAGGMPVQRWADQMNLSYRDMRRFTVLVGATCLAGGAVALIAAVVA